MNEICRKMWDRDLTIKKWSEQHGFNHRYVQALTTGVRGKWNCGKGKKIMEVLKAEGYLDTENKTEGEPA
jgi:hypothetical protein